MMKKLFAILLAILCLVPLASCGAYSDEEANEILDAILIREAELNGYIYFNSFKTKEDPGDDVDSDFQKYYLVHPDSKYVTLASLMGEVDALYTVEGRENVYEHAFTGLDDGETVSRPPRFFEDEEGLKINVAGDKYSGRTLALLGSAKVKRSNATHIRAEITTYRFDSEGNPILHIKEVELLYEDGAWKLMGQTLIAGTTTEKLI